MRAYKVFQKHIYDIKFKKKVDEIIEEISKQRILNQQRDINNLHRAFFRNFVRVSFWNFFGDTSWNAFQYFSQD